MARWRGVNVMNSKDLLFGGGKSGRTALSSRDGGVFGGGGHDDGGLSDSSDEEGSGGKSGGGGGAGGGGGGGGDGGEEGVYIKYIRIGEVNLGLETNGFGSRYGVQLDRPNFLLTATPYSKSETVKLIINN